MLVNVGLRRYSGRPGSGASSMTVLNSASASFSVPLQVLNAAGASFTVTNSVLNAAGTPFTVI